VNDVDPVAAERSCQAEDDAQSIPRRLMQRDNWHIVPADPFRRRTVFGQADHHRLEAPPIQMIIHRFATQRSSPPMPKLETT